jgi:guanylate kinase
MNEPRVIIISGPSGVGKSSVVRRLLEQCDLPLELSVSATTRPPRPGEIDHQDYHFLGDEEFQRRRRAGEFLECAEVFGRNWYGTLRETVTTGLKRGKWIILEIDVEGAAQVLREYPQALSVFIHPGSPQELERRLRGRQSDSEEAIQRRLEVARQELKRAPEYRFVVVNQAIEAAAEEVCRLLKQSGD